jgi:hypothetical protein
MSLTDDWKAGKLDTSKKFTVDNNGKISDLFEVQDD